MIPLPAPLEEQRELLRAFYRTKERLNRLLPPQPLPLFEAEWAALDPEQVTAAIRETLAAWERYLESRQ
ncbi:MAG: hypothetical protein C4316_09105 [Chloroflexota bacterium]